MVREAAATSRDCSAPPRTPGGVEEPTPEGFAGTGGAPEATSEIPARLRARQLRLEEQKRLKERLDFET